MLEEVKKSGPGNVLNEDVILAQGIVFFIAGFETSSNTLSSLTYHLAKNPEVQVRLPKFTILYTSIVPLMDFLVMNNGFMIQMIMTFVVAPTNDIYSDEKDIHRYNSLYYTMKIAQ